METPDVIKEIEWLNHIEWLEDKIEYQSAYLDSLDLEDTNKKTLQRIKSKIVEYKSRKAMLEAYLYPKGNK